MPERSGKANRWHTVVKGHFVEHWYELFGQRQFDQFFLTDARWQKFLTHPDTKSFAYTNVNKPDSLITLRREKRANGQFWYAFKKAAGKLYKVYVGKSEELTYERLQEAVKALQAKINDIPAPDGNVTNEYIDLLSQVYSARYGHSWLYEGAKLHTHGRDLYLILSDGTSRYLPSMDIARSHLMNYCKTGKPNNAMLRQK